MANKKIVDFTVNTAPASGDLVEMVDISDTTDAASGSSKQVTAANLITKAHGLSDSTVIGVASGVLTSGIDVAVTDGGTGASTASGARTNLGVDAIATKLSKLDATAPPTANDDSGDGYAVGSIWVDVTNDKSYVCVDATLTAAVWNDLTASAAGGINNVVEDTTPQLGGDLDLNGNQITSPDGTDLINIPNGSIDLQTASTSRLDISDLGVRLGGLNARVTTILDEDNMASDSATALATQQSIKAYADTKQPLDADLTTIAGLTATTDNFIQSKSSAWASRTPTQVTADLIAMVGDSGSGGTKGLVPAPGAGDAAAGKFLKADGTWTAPAGGGTSTRAHVDFSAHNRDTADSSTHITLASGGTGASSTVTGSSGTSYYELVGGSQTTSYATIEFNPSGTDTFEISGVWGRSILSQDPQQWYFVDFSHGTAAGNYCEMGLGIGHYANGNSTAYNAAGEDGCGFYAAVSNGTGTLYAFTFDETTATTTNVTANSKSINQDSDSRYDNCGWVMDSGTNVKFYMNGTLVATHTTNLPAGRLNSRMFTAWVTGETSNTVAGNMRISVATCSFDPTL